MTTSTSKPDSGWLHIKVYTSCKNVITLLLMCILHYSQYTKAKETYLQACRKTPSSQTWRGVGMACYYLNDLPQAEDALCEANILNNLDSTVWAYLTLVCLKVGWC